MMKELSLNILDIVQNSVTAKATHVEITLAEEGDTLTLSVTDNGCGMSPEFLARVTDPFTTSRTTRSVGLGIPLLKMAAEMAGGHFSLESQEGHGTALTAVFGRGNIDTPPIGDMTGTMTALVQGAPDIDFVYTRRRDGQEYTLDCAELREMMEDVPLNEPDVLTWIAGFLDENEAELTPN